MREMSSAIRRYRPRNPAQGRPEAVLVENELAGALPTLPQLDKATPRAAIARRGAKPMLWEFRGEKLSIRQISECTGLPLHAVRKRLQPGGFDNEPA
jgi:hypothetical protein